MSAKQVVIRKSLPSLVWVMKAVICTLFLIATSLSFSSAFTLPQFKVVPDKPKSIYFSGAGIYFWWQLGVAKYMKENCKPEFIYDTPIMGASAGSITASMLLTGADLDALPDLALEEAVKRNIFDRPTGLAGVWGDLVRDWLYKAIPDDFDAKNIENLDIAITPNFGTPKLVSDFRSKDELIDAILASCHIPLFLNGKLYSDYKGERVVDGSFWYFVTKDRYTGLPLPEGIEKNEIFWVDYCDDEDFMMTVSGNFLELANPQGVYDMIESGFNFMKREHYYGRLPYAKKEKPTFVVEPVYETISSTIKSALASWDTENLYKIPAKYASWAKDSIRHGAATVFPNPTEVNRPADDASNDAGKIGVSIVGALAMLKEDKAAQSPDSISQTWTGPSDLASLVGTKSFKDIFGREKQLTTLQADELFAEDNVPNRIDAVKKGFTFASTTFRSYWSQIDRKR